MNALEKSTRAVIHKPYLINHPSTIKAMPVMRGQRPPKLIATRAMPKAIGRE